MTSQTLVAREAKAFVPARDFDTSRHFYGELGFVEEWCEGDLACFRHGSAAFLLQHYYVAEHTNNFMMHLLVERVDAWYEHAARVAAAFGTRADAPVDQPWGLRDFALFDPSGVLWRIAEPLAE